MKLVRIAKITMNLNLPNPWKPPFSRVMVGPLESANPWDTYIVSGEIHIPLLDPIERERAPRVFDPRFNIQTWAFNMPVKGTLLKTENGRQYIEDKVRHKFYSELISLWPIRMKIERSYNRYSSDSIQTSL